MPAYIKTGATTWKLFDPHFKTGATTWKGVANGYIKTGATTWKQFYTALTITLSDAPITGTNPGTPGEGPTVTYRVSNDGNVYKDEGLGSGFEQINVTLDWIRPTSEAGSAYTVRFTDNGGSAGTVGGTFGSWLTLDLNRDISYKFNSGGSGTRNFTAEISDDGGSTTLDSATITLTSEDST